ncbi:MAG: lysozyme [Xanthobacteraceae bacterium]
MNDDFRLSDGGEQFIKRKEKCARRVGPDAFKPYICPAGIPTIAWGHTNATGRQFSADAIWTQAECDAAFEEDAFNAGCHVKALVRVTLTQGQYDALVSFVFNCGWGALAKSTLLAKLNRRDYAGAAREFLKWTHAGPEHVEEPGLVSRRIAESAMFKGAGVIETPDDGDMPQRVNAPIAAQGSGAGHLAGLGLGGLTLSRVGSLITDHLERLTDLKSQWDELTNGADVWKLLSDPHVLFWIATLTFGWCLYTAYRHAHRENQA